MREMRGCFLFSLFLSLQFFFPVLGFCGPFWATSIRFGLLWSVLGLLWIYFGLLWSVLGYLDPFWATLVCFGATVKLCWATLVCFGATVDLFWATVVRFRLLWSVLVQLPS